MGKFRSKEVHVMRVVFYEQALAYHTKRGRYIIRRKFCGDQPFCNIKHKIEPIKRAQNNMLYFFASAAGVSNEKLDDFVLFT